ncbi:MAG TPA: hypothetical protein VK835_05070 [Bacteroidia bacterium]|nr:hypothetical protein [Bacteroidia bacterium]
MDSTIQKENNFKTNILFDPPYTSTHKDLIDLKKKNYIQIFSHDSVFGEKNPFYNADFKKNKADYYLALETYAYNDTFNQNRKYTRKDSERIFEIKYWKQYMDSTGHKTKNLTSEERDSLFNNEMEKNWKIFSSEFGDCFISYEIPIFNHDFSYCYFEWSFACKQDIGKGFRGLYKKDNGKWKLMVFHETWTNEKKNNH